MSWFVDANGDAREIDDTLMAAWIEAGNPKAQAWTPIPTRPSESHQWDGVAWVPPAPAAPATVSARQIRLWLIRSGIALSAVDAAIGSIPDTLTRDSVRVEWEYAPYVERSHPMLVPLAAALGLTVDDVDRAFAEAASL